MIVAVGGMKGIGNMGKGGIPKGNGTGGTGVPPLFTEVGRLVLLFKPAVPVGSINFIFLVSGWLPSLELPCSSSCFFKNVSTSFSLSWLVLKNREGYRGFRNWGIQSRSLPVHFPAPLLRNLCYSTCLSLPAASKDHLSRDILNRQEDL